MPAGSDLTLPQTFRPYGVRIAIYVAGGLLVLVLVVTWLAFPKDIQDQFTFLQRATVIGLGLMFYAGGYALARSRLVAREEGLTVVNGYKTRRLEWNEILAITLRPGSPWAVLDLADGTSVPAMGIQGSDGARATAQVRRVRALVEHLTH
jgi:Bacterial PH domain